LKKDINKEVIGHHFQLLKNNYFTKDEKEQYFQLIIKYLNNDITINLLYVAAIKSLSVHQANLSFDSID